MGENAPAAAEGDVTVYAAEGGRLGDATLVVSEGHLVQVQAGPEPGVKTSQALGVAVVEAVGRYQRDMCTEKDGVTSGSVATTSTDKLNPTVADTASAQRRPLPCGLRQRELLVSGGRSTAAKRRQRRTECELAAARGILTTELRLENAERAKVLRATVRGVIEDLRAGAGALPDRRHRHEVRRAVAEVRRAGSRAASTRSAVAKPRRGQLNVESAAGASLEGNEESPLATQEVMDAPAWLEETGTLSEMRAVRRRALKMAKKFRAQKRVQRLQQQEQRQQMLLAAKNAGRPAKAAGRQRKPKRVYKYERQGGYGDVELVPDENGKKLRLAQLHAAGSGPMYSLPTTLLAVSRTCTLEARLDTCAQFSVAGRELRKYGRCMTRDVPVDVVEGFCGGRLRVLGVWRFVGTTQYLQRVTVDALLVDGQGGEFLIGEDWMLQHQVKLDFGTRELKYRGEDGCKVILPFTCHGVTATTPGTAERKTVVRLAKTVKLQTNTHSNIQVKVDAEDGTTGIFLPKPSHKRYLLMAPTVDVVREGTVRVSVLNIEGRREKLPAREALGTWIPMEETMEILTLNGELERERVAEWVNTLKIDDAPPLAGEEALDIGEMEPADRDLVIAVLRQFRQTVEKKEGCPPAAKTNVQHHINTGSTAPIMLRRRRHAVSENALIDNEVDTMLANDVIEEGEGAWGFPVVIVRKKDGSVRFCIDYRALNAVTAKDVYPLPRVDETLEALHGSTRFTSLDLHSGYWQLLVAPEDREKTAFTTRRGLFQFKRMPFGLCNAPSTFQRLMDCVLRGLTWVCCLVYLDDVVIFTKGSVARHIVELAVVLERLEEAGLSLKPSKCCFAATQMEYLGHDLTTEGIRPTERLVKSVRDFPRPTTAAEVRSFVALAGYYRRFMPGFGARMAPLTTLLRKTAKWTWQAEQEEAFLWAKACLSQKPVLIYPDYSLPFKLTTDASKAGLGAVLSQDQGRGDQPVAYASKVNSPAVSKYTISELECLAVVWAVRLFRPHLYGRRFTIVTDHVALKWLMTAKEPAGRLHRWALTLQEFDFEIVYRPGKDNCVADALSRCPTKGDPDDEAKDAEEAEDEPMIVCNELRAAVVRMLGAERPDEKSTSEATPCLDVDRLSAIVAPPSRPLTLTKAALAKLAATAFGVAERNSSKMATAANDSADNHGNDGRTSLEDDIDTAAKNVVQAVAVQRVEARELGVVQFTDADIREEQRKSVMVQTLLHQKTYRGQRVSVKDDGLVYVETGENEERILLPTVFWPLAFKEAHDSIWAGHLRGPQTYDRLRRTYWWPHMREAVLNWVAGCQDCGSRKARPKAVIPPLRSVRTGDVGDRWAIDVAGPLPVTAHRNRYVIAAVEYATRYAVAQPVPEHTAKSIAKVLMNRVVLVYGPMREIMMDGAMEFGSKATEELLALLQAKQSTPVPYRPNLLGLVERFHRTWKDIVSLYVNEVQDDWDDFLPSALYAYNSSKHATHGYQPNELMMGRKLRSPGELLRRSRLTYPHQTLQEYHQVLLRDLKKARELAAIALRKEQARQATYYNRRTVRQHGEFRPGQLVWVYRPARGPGITKFAHRWRGPGQIIEAAGYDNFLVKMLESDKEIVTHCSFLLSFYYPQHLLGQMAKDIELDLRREAMAATDRDPDDELAEGTELMPDGDENNEATEALATDHVTTGLNSSTSAWQQLSGARSPPRTPANSASRTRARIRQAPYDEGVERDEQQSEADGSVQEGHRRHGTSDAGEQGAANPVHRHGHDAATGDGDAATSSPQEREQLNAFAMTRGAGLAETEEPRVYVFAGGGRRGVDRLASRSRLTRLQPGESVVELRRRKYRTRTGRYAMEFEIRRAGERLEGSNPEAWWINQDDYEKLWRDGLMRLEPCEDSGINGGEDAVDE